MLKINNTLCALRYLGPLLALMVLPLTAGHTETISESAPMARTTTTKPNKPAPNKPVKGPLPLAKEKLKLVALEQAPFPYRGKDPETGKPFHDVVQGARRGHTSARGGLYWERATYSDKRSLLYMPQGFDVTQPALIVVYFHGNQSELLRDVRDRQQVPRQLAESGMNAALIAPQFAVDALDSSAGRFWQKGQFARYIREATAQLSILHGDPRAHLALNKAPILLVAYSGGYHPAAYAASHGGLTKRLLGMFLLDAPFGDEAMIADWVATKKTDGIFVSTYSGAARGYNQLLRLLLKERGVKSRATLPIYFHPGTVALVDTGDDVNHMNFVTDAWTTDPLTSLLSRVRGFARTPEPLASGSK